MCEIWVKVFADLRLNKGSIQNLFKKFPNSTVTEQSNLKMGRSLEEAFRQRQINTRMTNKHNDKWKDIQHQNLYLQKKSLYTNLCSSSIHNSYKLDTIQCLSIGAWVICGASIQ